MAYKSIGHLQWTDCETAQQQMMQHDKFFQHQLVFLCAHDESLQHPHLDVETKQRVIMATASIVALGSTAPSWTKYRNTIEEDFCLVVSSAHVPQSAHCSRARRLLLLMPHSHSMLTRRCAFVRILCSTSSVHLRARQSRSTLLVHKYPPMQTPVHSTHRSHRGSESVRSAQNEDVFIFCLPRRIDFCAGPLTQSEFFSPFADLCLPICPAKTDAGRRQAVGE